MRVALLIVLVPLVAVAAPKTLDGFRCPDTGRIISLGASRYEVEALCRAPDDRIVTTEERLVQRRARASDLMRQGTTTTSRTTRTPPPATTTTSSDNGTGVIVAMYRAPAATETTTTTTTTTGARVQSVTSETLVAELQEVLVEEWTYDFGSNRFLRFLRFENGRLVTVHDGPKGAKPPQQ